MLSINNGFLGYYPTIHNILFNGSDDEKLYQDNLKSQPNDWYYRTNQISYVYNNNGHRCNDIEDIDLENYILFAGCSHTEGIGLKLEDTYPYLLTQYFKCSYYNLALGGTGPDTMIYNIATWFAKTKKLPKLLVVQWPHHIRIVIRDYSKSENVDPIIWNTSGSWNADKNSDMSKFFVYGNSIKYFDSQRLLFKNLIKNIAPCPVLYVTTENDQFLDGQVILKQLDDARDIRPLGSHLGIKSQIYNSGLLYTEINNLLNN